MAYKRGEKKKGEKTVNERRELSSTKLISAEINLPLTVSLPSTCLYGSCPVMSSYMTTPNE